jgi:alpha-tubulin suppressor-like RCC1 family protein
VTGRYHTCALLDDHKVKCWGDNGSGQLGLGDKKFRGRDLADMGNALLTVDLGTGRTAKTIAAGRDATCAILDNDALKCWGMGQLTGQPLPTDRGDEPGEMGDALPAVDLGTGRTARRIAVSHGSACVERDDGTVRCWGTSDAPKEVKVDGKVASLAGVLDTVAIFDDGTVATLGSTTAGATAPRLTLPRPARAVSGAFSSWCAVLDDATLSCQGSPSDLPPPGTKVAMVALTDQRDFAALLPDGTVRTWKTTSAFPWNKVPASDPMGGSVLQLGQPATAITSAGYDHTCALLADGSIKCWARNVGSNEAGIGSGPNDGISGTTWRAVDLGTHE